MFTSEFYSQYNIWTNISFLSTIDKPFPYLIRIILRSPEQHNRASSSKSKHSLLLIGASTSRTRERERDKISFRGNTASRGAPSSRAIFKREWIAFAFFPCNERERGDERRGGGGRSEKEASRRMREAAEGGRVRGGEGRGGERAETRWLLNEFRSLGSRLLRILFYLCNHCSSIV